MYSVYCTSLSAPKTGLLDAIYTQKMSVATPAEI